jgi:hypothetical protein
MVTKYVTLKTSDESMSKRFKAIGYRPFVSKKNSIEFTDGGGIDLAAGAVFEGVRYVFRVPQDSEDILYGTLDDLKYLHSLNNPNATPSNRITLIDHYGESSECFFLNNDLDIDPLTTIISGYNSWFLVAVELIIIQAVEAS